MLKSISSIMLIVAVFCFASNGQAAVVVALLPESPPPFDKPALLDPASDALAIVFDAFVDSGYGPHTAMAHAHRVMQLSYPDLDVQEEPAIGEALLDPKSDALAIVFDAFFASGWSAHDAMTHARSVLGLGPLEGGCEKNAYRVTITFCDGNGERYVQGWLNARCYEDPDGDPFTADGLQICDMFSCQTNQYRWLSLTVATSCGGLPGSGTCVQLRIANSTAVLTPCERIEYECNCFTETNPVNCSNIESCCCSSATAGCNGCPACTSPCASP